MAAAAPGWRLVLASASPGRRSTLRAAGIEPQVQVSGVDETPLVTEPPVALVLRLAELKARAVARRLRPGTSPVLVLGCDSMLELDGVAYGKPRDAADAAARWRAMRERSGVLHTGHHVVRLDARAEAGATASTRVDFAAVSDTEIDAYVATGEPLRVAGGFTIDGLGGAFVRGVEGDPHNVVGISLPLLRELVAELGVAWTDLWAR